MLKFKDDVFIKAGFHIGQKGMVIDWEEASNKYLILIEKSGNYKRWFEEKELESVGPRVKVY